MDWLTATCYLSIIIKNALLITLILIVLLQGIHVKW
jgi:hypothetical protein